MGKTVVVALGGNAITRSGQAGTYAEQAENALGMADAVCRLRAAGWTVVLVHGNGPQVGNLAVQQQESTGKVPEQPLHVLGAMTEGQLGSLLTLALLRVCGSTLSGVATVVTHVVVDPDDPGFSRPTKPIGPFLSEAEARRHADEQGWTVGEDAGRGYRRLVASPAPLRIVELDALRALVDRGVVVIAAGGGGVPVVRDEVGYRGVDAVIDKDLAAQRLATELGAEALVLVTDVPQVMIDYGTPNAHPIDRMTVSEAQAHADDHQFPEGSMGPKMRGAIQFLRAGGRLAVITNAERACASLDPNASPEADLGTRIVAADLHLGAAP
ncbi:carbamate kinase [Pseudonocardia spinosispora]|uniref:carbamate kinase n=1 Tax=Pseudonocardia spinosispora TaxID=103441 RepID=UPI0004240023|nr:carbamate kinase [Pseudonocardia spinosispora]